MQKNYKKHIADIQISGTFPQYMVVFIARTTEGCIKEIIFNKCKLKNNDQIYLNEIQKILKNFQNPTRENIYKFFSYVLDINLENNNFKNIHFTALGQILKDRHKIAHSQTDHPFLSTYQNLQSLNDIKKHYENVKDFISKLLRTSKCKLEELL
jgi:6-pyruvoyl-tetrahydropterin synthase